MPYLAVADTRLYYEEEGPSGGRPLLLLHAALQTADSMEPLRRALGPEGFRIVAPDQRGHGRTAHPGGAFTIGRLADDAGELIGRLGLERPVVIGYSLGGIVALELARRGLTAGLVAMAARMRPVPAGRSAFDPAAIARRSPRWAEQLAEKHREMDWRQLAPALGSLLETWQGFAAADLGAVRIPALVIQGDRDEMVPLDQARELAAAIPGADLAVIPQAGHSELLYRSDALHRVHDFVTALA